MCWEMAIRIHNRVLSSLFGEAGSVLAIVAAVKGEAKTTDVAALTTATMPLIITSCLCHSDSMRSRDPEYESALSERMILVISKRVAGTENPIMISS